MTKLQIEKLVKAFKMKRRYCSDEDTYEVMIGDYELVLFKFIDTPKHWAIQTWNTKTRESSGHCRVDKPTDVMMSFSKFVASQACNGLKASFRKVLRDAERIAGP